MDESTIIFQSFLFANIPAEPTSYAPNFFVGIIMCFGMCSVHVM